MREILFRGKRIDNEEWVFGSLLIDGEAHKPASKENLSFSKHYIVPETDAEHIQTRFNDGAFYLNTIAYHIIPETVGQFTGLTDKNGKKIFEGDICCFREWSKGEMCWVGKVHWEHQQFMISGGQNKECETMFELCMSRFIPENIEVIGNIHDNTELLETP